MHSRQLTLILIKEITLKNRTLLAAVLLIAGTGILQAGTVGIDFETLPDQNFFSADGLNIGSFYSGITFGPGVTGLSISRFGGFDSTAYPVHSGDVAVWSASDNDTTLVFSGPQTLVSFWYTSFDPITVTAFDGGAATLSSVVGGANTDGTTGVSSLVSISAAGIASVTISSSAGQYVFDDLTFSTDAVVAPEPETAFLLPGVLWLCLLGKGWMKQDGRTEAS